MMPIDQNEIGLVSSQRILASLKKRGEIFFEWDLNEIREEIDSALLSKDSINPKNWGFNQKDWQFLTDDNLDAVLRKFLDEPIIDDKNIVDALKEHVFNHFIENDIQKRVIEAIREAVSTPQNPIFPPDQDDDLCNISTEILIDQLIHHDVMLLKWSDDEIWDYFKSISFWNFNISKNDYRGLDKYRVMMTIKPIFLDFIKKAEADVDFTDFMFSDFQCRIILEKWDGFIPELVKKVLGKVTDDKIDYDYSLDFDDIDEDDLDDGNKNKDDEYDYLSP